MTKTKYYSISIILAEVNQDDHDTPTDIYLLSLYEKSELNNVSISLDSFVKAIKDKVEYLKALNKLNLK